jgi:hypothetical protein
MEQLAASAQHAQADQQQPRFQVGSKLGQSWGATAQNAVFASPTD